MSTTSITFDTLDCFERLTAAGVPEPQAKVQTSIFREYSMQQDARIRQELATKMDLAEMEMRLNLRIESTKHELLKWLFGTALTIVGILTGAMYFLLRAFLP